MKIKFAFNLLIYIFMPILMLAGNDGVNINTIKSENWQLYKTQDGVQVYYKLNECNDIHNGIHKQVIAIKLVNTNSYEVRIQWKNELWYNDNCYTCGQDKENYVKRMLNPDESLESNCDTNVDLNIFVKYLNYNDKPELKKFEFKNIKVIKK